eukprot:scaffold22168_cov49-Phaeocystis_antarctica.AAC.3
MAFQPRTCVVNATKPQALARGDGGTKAPGDLCGVGAPLECAQSCTRRPGCRAMAQPRGHFQRAVARAPRQPRAVSRASGRTSGAGTARARAAPAASRSLAAACRACAAR